MISFALFHGLVSKLWAPSLERVVKCACDLVIGPCRIRPAGKERKQFRGGNHKGRARCVDLEQTKYFQVSTPIIYAARIHIYSEYYVPVRIAPPPLSLALSTVLLDENSKKKLTPS